MIFHHFFQSLKSLKPSKPLPPSYQIEFKILKKAHLKDFSKLLFLIISSISIALIITHSIKNHLSAIILPSIWLAISAILCIFFSCFQNFIDYLLFVVYLVYCSTYLLLVKDITDYPSLNNINAFLSYGYIYGLLEKIAITKLPHFSLKVILTLVSMALRLYFYPLEHALPIIIQVLMLIFSLGAEYLRERRNLKIVQNLSKYREDLTKFKTLVASDLPTNVLIISTDLKQILFKNEGLTHNIKNQFPSDNNQEGLELLYEWLRHSNIDNDSLNNDENDEYSTSHIEWGKSWSVLHFLKIISRGQNLRTLKQKKHQFNAEFHPSSSSPRKVYHIKVFALSWDEQDALALILNDITDHFQNLTLKVADANKNKMLAMISHELKTPLNGILGVVNILKKELTQPHLLQYLNICKNSGELLLSLVNSILDLQKIRDNKFILKLSKDNLHQLLMDIYNLFKFQFDQKSLDLQLLIFPNVPQFIVTDQNRLRQILINIIGNSLKFTFKGGVTISVSSSTEGYINIKVADTGIGISQENQKKLFKMYGRLDQPDPSVNTQGTGFGLEISNQLVKQLSSGGNKKSYNTGIDVESQLGVGTVFSFNIWDNSQQKQEGSEEDSSESEMKYYEPKIFEEDIENISVKMSPYSLLSSVFLTEKTVSPRLAKLFQSTPSKRHITTENDFKHLTRVDSFEVLLNNEAISPKNYNQKALLLTPLTKQQSFRSKISKSFEKTSTRMTTNSHVMFTKRTQSFSKPNMKILLVDDNPFNLMIAKHILEGLKFSVITALNGRIAINPFLWVNEMIKTKNSQDTSICLILMDIQMPVMDGFEATRELRKMMENKEIADIPIVALSANDSEDDKRRGKEVGMYTHLSKPLKEEALRIILEEIMRKTLTENELCEMESHPHAPEMK